MRRRSHWLGQHGNCPVVVTTPLCYKSCTQLELIIPQLRVQSPKDNTVTPSSTSLIGKSSSDLSLRSSIGF